MSAVGLTAAAAAAAPYERHQCALQAAQLRVCQEASSHSRKEFASLVDTAVYTKYGPTLILLSTKYGYQWSVSRPYCLLTNASSSTPPSDKSWQSRAYAYGVHCPCCCSAVAARASQCAAQDILSLAVTCAQSKHGADKPDAVQESAFPHDGQQQGRQSPGAGAYTTVSGRCWALALCAAGSCRAYFRLYGRTHNDAQAVTMQAALCVKLHTVHGRATKSVLRSFICKSCDDVIAVLEGLDPYQALLATLVCNVPAGSHFLQACPLALLLVVCDFWLCAMPQQLLPLLALHCLIRLSQAPTAVCQDSIVVSSKTFKVSTGAASLCDGLCSCAPDR